MESINIRYGESLTLPLSTGDQFAVSADIFIGKPGQLYVLTKKIDLFEGEGVFNFTPEETRIPLGTYSYQINVTDALGQVEKYPSPERDCSDCESNFPQFVVYEALDETEVS